MKRRDFIAGLGGTTVTWPVAAWAQQSMPVVGYLGPDTPDRYASRLHSFHRGLGSAGFSEGKNIKVEYRWAEGKSDRLPALALSLVRAQASVIVTTGSLASAHAAKAATRSIPIVFETGADPIQSGLVASLNRPGGNVTGITSLNAQVGPKRLELLHELLPSEIGRAHV